jgi:hypothetical protein
MSTELERAFSQAKKLITYATERNRLGEEMVQVHASARSSG